MNGDEQDLWKAKTCSLYEELEQDNTICSTQRCFPHHVRKKNLIILAVLTPHSWGRPAVNSLTDSNSLVQYILRGQSFWNPSYLWFFFCLPCEHHIMYDNFMEAITLIYPHCAVIFFFSIFYNSILCRISIKKQNEKQAGQNSHTKWQCIVPKNK